MSCTWRLLFIAVLFSFCETKAQCQVEAEMQEHLLSIKIIDLSNKALKLCKGDPTYIDMAQKLNKINKDILRCYRAGKRENFMGNDTLQKDSLLCFYYKELSNYDRIQTAIQDC